MVLASEHRTIKLPDGLDFFARAHQQWPASRWSVELDLANLPGVAAMICPCGCLI